MGGLLMKSKQNATTPTNESNILLASSLSGLETNPIVDFSLEFLLLSFRLSKISTLEVEIEQLKEDFVRDILSLSAKLSALKKYDENDLIKLRYCLCVFIDESLMKNPLFLNSTWANNTLTVRLFDEALGGNNFYDIVHFWLNAPKKNRDFLEFIYVCLVLGYQGKYTEYTDVKEQIMHLCNNLATNIATHLNTNANIAFTKGYNPTSKQSFLGRLQGFKKIFILISIFVILCAFFYAFFTLQTNTLQTQEKLQNILQNFNKTQ